MQILYRSHIGIIVIPNDGSEAANKHDALTRTNSDHYGKIVAYPAASAVCLQLINQANTLPKELSDISPASLR